MRTRPALLLFFLLAAPLFLLLCERSWEMRRDVRGASRAGYLLPAEFSRIMALDYQGLLSDYQFLRLLNFYGERVLAQRPLDAEDWGYLEQGLETITDLDPYFKDVYLFGESVLAWETGKAASANRLLRKGMERMPDDWRLPFFIGSNYLLFLEDAAQAGEYFRIASKLPDSPSFLPTLAARMDYYAGKSKTAILFLQGLLEQTADPRLRESLERRLKALEAAAEIEEALKAYREERGGDPSDLQALTREGYLEDLPQDPYGGEWVILKSGRVFSTSRFVMRPSPADGSSVSGDQK